MTQNRYILYQPEEAYFITASSSDSQIKALLFNVSCDNIFESKNNSYGSNCVWSQVLVMDG